MSVLSYLKFVFADEEALKKAEPDMMRMLELAKQQPGFEWAEVAKSDTDPLVYVVVSSWATRDDMRAWEHHPDHEAIMNAHRYKLEHKRYVPEPE